ncbi:hypothetical protein ACFL6U_04670 [Planctomycetota bacterium]
MSAVHVRLSLIMVLGMGRAPLLHAGPHDVFLSGPWEILVKVGLDGTVLRFPLEVADTDKPQQLDKILPILGTSVVVTCEHYVPDLIWEMQSVPEANGGSAAKLHLQGEGLHQQFWLHSRDAKRRSISSPIGGVEIRELRDVDHYDELLQTLTSPGMVGVLTVSEREYAIAPDTTVVLPAEGGKLSVLRYVPHYSVDKETKQVVCLSEKSVNPALKIRLEREGKTYERWLWSHFSEPPHQKVNFPAEVGFTNYRVDTASGKFLLVVARGKEPQLFLQRNDAFFREKARLNHAYSFADARYSFSFTDIKHDTVVKNIWKNKSDRLLRPAVIGTIKTEDVNRQVILEFNKPYHYKTKDGIMVLVYQRQRNVG